MKIKTTNKVMTMLIALSSLAILIGALLKLSLYPIGSSILWGGIISDLILSSYEISRLKKIIAKSNTTDYEYTNR